MAQQFISVEESLKKHLPEEDKKEVFRILYGRELELVFPLKSVKLFTRFIFLLTAQGVGFTISSCYTFEFRTERL
jgi:hypothetical protein